MSVRTSKSPMAVGVTYDRSESPGTPRRRSSAFQGPGSRQGSFVGSMEKARNFSRQWDSPRGSLAGIGTYPRDSPRGSLVSGTLPRSRSPSAPQTSFGRTNSHSPAALRNFVNQTHVPGNGDFVMGREGSKISKSNGPSPLLKDGTDSALAKIRSQYDTPNSNRHTLSQKVSKEELLLPARSDSSCSLTLESTKLSEKDAYTSRRQKSGDALTICDSSSEVSDEGYKSSQGNVSKTEETLTSQIEISTKGIESEERPESSMTVGSECSSTISTEDERTHSPIEDQDGSSSQTIIADPTSNKLECPQLIEKVGQDSGSGDMTEHEIKKTGNQLSPTTKNRLANLFNRIPKFGKTRKGAGEDGELDTNYVSQQASAKPNIQSSGSANSSPVKTLPPPAQSRSKRSTAVNLNTTRPELTRTRSSSSDNGFSRGGERGSYRAPKGTSRYMQAAEAYANKGKTVNSNNSTWSASSVTRARSRPGLSSDLFQPPQKHSRTASASPGLHRKRNPSLSKQTSPTTEYPAISSTHSTPSRRPTTRRQTSRELLDLGSFENDEMILKRMEEILFTYKSKVEDKLAAEGKELPKDIFEDFTSHWVNSSPHRAKSVDSLDSSEKSSEKGSYNRVKVSPSQRKEHRDGQKMTRIPVPTFYKSPIPSETHL